MENELYIFQTQIEQKFRKSEMNKNFTFPLIERKLTVTSERQKPASSFEEYHKKNLENLARQ